MARFLHIYGWAYRGHRTNWIYWKHGATRNSRYPRDSGGDGTNWKYRPYRKHRSAGAYCLPRRWCRSLDWKRMGNLFNSADWTARGND